MGTPARTCSEDLLRRPDDRKRIGVREDEGRYGKASASLGAIQWTITVEAIRWSGRAPARAEPPIAAVPRTSVDRQSMPRARGRYRRVHRAPCRYNDARPVRQEAGADRMSA